MSRSSRKIYVWLGAAALVVIVAVWLVLSNLGPNESGGNAGVASEEPAAATEGNAPVVEEGDADEAAAEEPAAEEPTAAAPPPVPSVEADLPSLAEVYAEYFPIGAAIEPNQSTGLKADLLKKHVNMLVAENVMKPDAMHPTEDTYNWTNADRIVAFAKENGMEVRFHTLVWHSQVGAWFFKDAEGKSMADETDPDKREANKKLLLERLDKHVRTIVERYKDDIVSWDVVNEVIEPGDPDGMRASDWYKITGTDFIETAFRAAREAGGPDIKLYINDYGTDDPRKRDILYDLVKKMLDKGVPIDGVGHQTHISVHGPMVFNIIESMKKFHELGLDNLVTELDMSLYNWNDRGDFGDEIPFYVLNRQAERYKELFDAFKEHKDMIGGVVFWGIADDHTWLHNFPVQGRTDAPMLFDEYLHAKPAFWAVADPSKLEEHLLKKE